MAATSTARTRQHAINPMDNPAKSNAEINSILASSQSPAPIISLPPADSVTLPGGLWKDGKVTRTAIVRELTGEHEEQLSRAAQSLNPFHFIDTLLKCGVKQIGDYPESDTLSLLKELLVGDREFLILEIRRATYGDEIDVEKWECPSCKGETDLHITLDEIPIRDMDSPEDTTFEVKLRKGKSAKARLATGHDQTAVFDNPKLTQAERDSVLLSKCVTYMTNDNGQEIAAIAWPQMAQKMSIPDRRAILEQLGKRQPGPRYNEVKFDHKDCGEQVTLMIGIGDLFLGI
jgi:hypothetical protein